MKHAFYILALAACLVACSKNGSSGKEPEVLNPPHNIISALIEDNGSSHRWSEGDFFGLYGSVSGENVRYVVEPVSFEKEGLTRIYGSGVDGDVYGYFPYHEDGYPAVAEGRQPLSPAQVYCLSAREQMIQNTILVAKLEDEILNFSWLCGVLHIHVTAGVSGTVRSASLLSAGIPVCGNYSITGTEPLFDDAGNELTLTGVGLPCEPDSPLDLYFMIPPGVYTSLSLSLTSELETVTKPVDLAVSIDAKAEFSCTVSEKETVYEGTDIIIIDGEFDD